MPTIHAYAAKKTKGKLEPFDYDPGKLAHDAIEVDVETCGICHSDLSMLNNDWGITEYPFVPGHEIVGRIAAAGENVKHLKVGQRVGVGWYSRSCLMCDDCMGGDQNLCATAEGTIVHRHGGFANKVRAQAAWATPIPEGIDARKAGPLFCAGITVFNPIVQNKIQPTDRVGVIGIGGLGHLAIQMLSAWGCHVTAFSTTPDKEEEARKLGAHDFVLLKDSAAFKKRERTFAMILDTVNVELDWDALLTMLRPKGKLHIVGAAPKVSATVFPMIGSQLSIGSSPLGSPATIRKMVDFVARHNIEVMAESFPMSKVNEAMEHLEKGKPRYRIVLENDF